MIQGMGGIMSITGQPDGTPGAEPMKVGVAFADIFTGLYATIGILAALHHRDRTGEGQHIDLALLDSQVAVLANQALNYLVGGTAPTRLGNAHPNIVPYQTFDTDGWPHHHRGGHRPAVPRILRASSACPSSPTMSASPPIAAGSRIARSSSRCSPTR